MRTGIRVGLLATLLTLGGSAFLFERVVDLEPHVGADFFFASNDPAVEASRWIERNFEAGGPYLFVSVEGRDIRAERYVDAVRRLSDRVEAFPDVTSVLSLTHGPSQVERAYDGPMWRRLLVDEASQSTLIIASLPGGTLAPGEMARLEEVARSESRDGRKVRLSGGPYVSAQIAVQLGRDLRTFTVASFALFGLVILAVFRSFAVLAGTLVACGTAILWTLVGNAWLGAGIGILTGNLATIVFVLTQSHIVFLSANQRRIARNGKDTDAGAPWTAVRRTLPASLGCMATTLLGFASLLFVDAEPLRQLGRGGVAGSLVALVCAYSLYPPFLALAASRWRARGANDPGALARRFHGLAGKPLRAAALGLVVLSVVLGTAIVRLDTDPSLLAYFDETSDLYEGLEFIDRAGGTSVLKIAVRDPGGDRLDDRPSYERLWDLQEAFESVTAVGATVSLPVLVAEGREESFIARLLGIRRLVDLLSGDRGSRVARSFVSEDRTEALFLMRMHETKRDEPREAVTERLGASVRQTGYEVRAIGGLFHLQGRLSALVGQSLAQGLAGLLGCFLLIGIAFSRSLRIGFAMAISIACVPLCLLGGLALASIPVDVISSPAANVCIGLAADSMIHLVAAARRAEARGFDAFVAARREQGVPILLSALVVCVGFSIFVFSSFPPNRRFGLAVVAGTGVAVASALTLLPLLAAGRTRSS